MRLLIILILLAPFSTQASFIFNYGLNYSSQAETSEAEFKQARTFHKVFLGATVNRKKTVFFGWNINSWTSSISTGGGEADTYSLLEMGPKLQWFLSEDHNWYISGEWNPYATGKRTKDNVDSEISGSSISVGLGYRYRISRLWGLGASLHYHSLSLKKETITSTETTISDKISNIMPMLEFSLITK